MHGVPGCAAQGGCAQRGDAENRRSGKVAASVAARSFESWASFIQSDGFVLVNNVRRLDRTEHHLPLPTSGRGMFQAPRFADTGRGANVAKRDESCVSKSPHICWT